MTRWLNVNHLLSVVSVLFKHKSTNLLSALLFCQHIPPTTQSGLPLSWKGSPVDVWCDGFQILSRLLHLRVVLYLFFFPLFRVFDLKYLSSSSFLTCCNLFIPSNLWFPAFEHVSLYLQVFFHLPPVLRRAVSSANIRANGGFWVTSSVSLSIIIIIPANKNKLRAKPERRWPLTFDPSVTPLLYHNLHCSNTGEGVGRLFQGKKEMYEHLENLSLPHRVKHSNLTVGCKC